MMITIAFINQKGGVGKTTSSAEVASRLARDGKRVLAIDADPQGNLSFIYGLDPDSIDMNLKAVFDGRARVEDTVIQTSENVFLVPNNIAMAGADRQYTGVNSMRILRKALSEVDKEYDYCIIDSPPNLGLISFNVLIASDFVVVPVNANALSIQGLKALSEAIGEVRESENPSLRILGILITRCNPRTNMTKEAIPALSEVAHRYLDTSVFDSKIRQSVAIEDAQASRHTLASGRRLPIASDYDALALEIISRSEAKTRKTRKSRSKTR